MREIVEAKREQLKKERGDYVNAIAFMEQSLAQHRLGLERIDGALVVVEGLLADAPAPLIDEPTPPAEEPKADEPKPDQPAEPIEGEAD